MRLIDEISNRGKEVITINTSEVTRLFQTYRDTVYRLALSFTRSAQEAEDVCQIVFLKLLEQKEIQPGKEKSWLMKVTANQCRSLLRSSWWKKTAVLEETMTVQMEKDREILQAVMALKPKYRVVVYLYYYEGYSAAEIAGLLHISQSAVTTRLARARQDLRETLKEE